MSDPNNVLSKNFKVPEGSVVVPQKFDTRVVDKNLSLGRITKAELDNYLNTLPDEAGSGDVLKYGDLVEDESLDSDSSDSGFGHSDGGSQGPLGGGSGF